MSNFLFPANPADGDVVVRGSIKGTYNAVTNTWEVGEVPQYPGVPGPLGPEGPQGPKGEPGSGVNVIGAVDTKEDLQVPSIVPNQFWLVNDTNTLFFSDGYEWFDLGSPIRGPQGFKGEPGTDGVDGGNGIAGRGWTGTDEIKRVSADGVVESYKVKFNSNDGLDFTTDELVGPAGWEPVYATADVPGLIKLGRGLDLDPGGDVNVKDTFVNIETVPLEGINGSSYMLQYKPITMNWPTGKYQNFSSGQGTLNQTGWYTSNTITVLPEELGTADAAIVYFQCSSDVAKSSSLGGSNISALRCYLSKNLIVQGGSFNESNAQIMGIPTTHNITQPLNANDRISRDPALTKNQLLRFTQGATLRFTIRIDLASISPMAINAGAGRVVLIPFRTDGAVGRSAMFAGNDPTVLLARDDEDLQNQIDNLFPPVTEETIAAEKASLLKESMKDAMNIINDELPYRTTTEQTALILIRDNIFALRTLPGTYAELNTLLDTYLVELENIVGFKFRFQPPV